MRIALCDDDASARQVMQELVLAFGKERGLNCETDVFSSGEEFTHEGKVFHSSVMMGMYISAE